MVPIQVPIIDYENPCYCPHPVKVSDSDVDPSISPFSRGPAAYNYERVKNRKFDTLTSSPNVPSFVYGRKRVIDDLSEERQAIVGRKFATRRIQYDSSPCSRFPSLDGLAPARKRTRYTSFAREPISGIPSVEWKQPCNIKQEHSSPILPAFPYRGEPVPQVLKEGNEDVPVLAFSAEYGMEDTLTTRTLLLRLEELFPRIGFGEAANSVQHTWPETDAKYRSERHQVLVDLLGEKGALNEYVLTALHDAEFRHLDLGPTMRGVNDLNLLRGDVMRVFSQPGWFKNLSTLSFAGGRFQNDFSLAYIRPLHQIGKLVLANTGIGNEGVFHIVALKHKLRHLDLSGNLAINDDSIPALILLEKLQYLSVSETGILMPGLRKLAVGVREGGRVVDVKIPRTCREYINGISQQYLLHPEPPLVSDPGVICMLSKAALSRNIEAHAAINPSIIFTGPRDEMEERLRKTLEVRKLDLAVREMVAGRDG